MEARQQIDNELGLDRWWSWRWLCNNAFLLAGNPESRPWSREAGSEC